MVVPGILLHKLKAPEGIRLEISAPDRLRAQEHDEVEVPVTIRNIGTSIATIRVTTGNSSAKTAEIGREAERKFTEHIRAALGLKSIAIIVEVKGPDERYALARGGSWQIPVTVKERTDKVEFSKALDVFSDLE